MPSRRRPPTGIQVAKLRNVVQQSRTRCQALQPPLVALSRPPLVARRIAVDALHEALCQLYAQQAPAARAGASPLPVRFQLSS